jgi:hypothetical protein
MPSRPIPLFSPSGKPLKHTCGLPERVCAEWQRRSFLDLPKEFSPYRHPRTKSTAEVGAVALIAYLKRKQSEAGVQRFGADDITLGKFARDMFTEGAPHLERWVAKGRNLKPQTIVQHRRHLAGYLLPKFGHLRFAEITPTLVEDFILDLSCFYFSGRLVMRRYYLHTRHGIFYAELVTPGLIR